MDPTGVAAATDRWVVRFGTYNLRDFGKHDSVEDQDRCDRVVEVIRHLDTATRP